MIVKKTAEVTEKIISSNELMMEAVNDSKKVNAELVTFLEKSLKSGKANSPRKAFSTSNSDELIILIKSLK